MLIVKRKDQKRASSFEHALFAFDTQHSKTTNAAFMKRIALIKMRDEIRHLQAKSAPSMTTIQHHLY
jgi:hypothetical protein